jgi:hypothetical protein
VAIIFVFILGCFPVSFYKRNYLLVKKASFNFFILVKISSLFTFRTFIFDPRKLKFCPVSKLCFPTFTLYSYCFFCIKFQIFCFLLINDLRKKSPEDDFWSRSKKRWNNHELNKSIRGANMARFTKA